MADRIVEEHLQKHLQDLELEYDRLQEEEHIQEEEKRQEDGEHQAQERFLPASRDIAEPDPDPALAPALHPNSIQLQSIVNTENRQNHEQRLLLQNPISEPTSDPVPNPNHHSRHASLPLVARDSLNIIKDAKDALDHKDLISFHALLVAAHIMISHSHPYDEEDFYWILVAAGNRMSEGYVKLAKRMIDDFFKNPHLNV